MDDITKTEKGRFLLRHISTCERCYQQFSKESNSIPKGKFVKRLDEIVGSNHRTAA